MNADAVRDNLDRARDRIENILAREGLTQPVTIIGVTKGHPADAVVAAAGAGLHHVGENRIQEALGKQDMLPDAQVTWHLIGRVQTNKAKLLPGRFGLIHAIDSLRLAEAVDRACARAEGDPAQPVLIQVNVAGETQKGGCAPEELVDLAQQIGGMEHLELRGLMTMAPFTSDETVHRNVFGGLRALREQLTHAGLTAPELSMGMSGDYPAAVAEGATMVRLGTTLFGERLR